MMLSQPVLAREWLMTDERMGERLWQAVARVPPGTGGIVFRHHSLNPDERLELGRKIASIAHARSLTLAVAGDEQLAHRLGASLVHNPAQPGQLAWSCSVHDEQEARKARDAGAALVFVSPVFATRSHPKASALGVEEAIRLAGIASCPAIALGGMDAIRFKAMDGVFHGYAGIDCWLRP